MRVCLLTPLHIGTGNDVPEYEYHWDSNQLRRLCLATLLTSDEPLAATPTDVATPDSLKSYLERVKARWPDHTLYGLRGEGAFFNRQRADVRECIKASLTHEPLLPGSSLKGALLTAWHFGKGWEYLSEADRTKLKDVGGTNFNGSLDHCLRQVLEPEWGFRNPNTAKLSDRLRLADMELSGQLLIVRAERVIKKKDGSPRILQQWVECVTSGAKGTMRVYFVEREESGYTVAELCRRANLFAECLIVAETQFFDYIKRRHSKSVPSAYQPTSSLHQQLAEVKQTQNSCLVRLGWASDKNAVSVTLLNSAADLSNQPLGRNNPRCRPKSRWLLQDGQPFGWCVVTFEEGDYGQDR